jgi:hypothetical protein
MLEAVIIRELMVRDPAGASGLAQLSAASGLAKQGDRLYVVADDENHLAVFDLSNREPGRLVALFDGDLPLRHKARKAAKPDCEAVLMLPAFGGYPHGAMMAMGSASRPSRGRSALIALDAAGELRGPARTVDLAPLLAPLHERIADLNIEGAFMQGDMLSLLQRGNSRSAINARIDFRWRDLQGWLASGGLAPQPVSTTPFELGAIDGVPLCFTDGAALAGGQWLYSAAAEDTSDTYSDGFCAGSVIGLVDADGTICRVERLSPACKVEGIAASANGNAIDLWLVTDADDRSKPALLLQTSLCVAGSVAEPPPIGAAAQAQRG